MLILKINQRFWRKKLKPLIVFDTMHSSTVLVLLLFHILSVVPGNLVFHLVFHDILSFSGF